MIDLEDILRPTQEQLFDRICQQFKGQTLISKGNFILVRGVAPVMLISHLDTVHQQPVLDIVTFNNGNILTSPQGIGGDDRCGVFAIVKVYEQSEIKPWLLFCCDEEIGGIGAKAFCLAYQQHQLPNNLNNLKFLVEIDRKGKNDAVYYDCFNPEFENYITDKGFKTAQGSFSDISLIAPELNIAAVNLSCGYYHAHTRHEYINRSELENTIQRVVEIVVDSTRADFPRYEYDTGFHNEQDYYDDFFWQEEESIDIPVDLPIEYREIYEELLYVYTAEELEDIRFQYGNHVLWQLYCDEFGSLYFDR